MMKRKYMSPSIGIYTTEDICEAPLTAATVKAQDGETDIDHFSVHENEAPNGEDDNAWFDDVNNWGGD